MGNAYLDTLERLTAWKGDFFLESAALSRIISLRGEGAQAVKALRISGLRGGYIFPPAQEIGERSSPSRFLMPTAPTRIKYILRAGLSRSAKRRERGQITHD